MARQAKYTVPCTAEEAIAAGVAYRGGFEVEIADGTYPVKAAEFKMTKQKDEVLCTIVLEKAMKIGQTQFDYIMPIVGAQGLAAKKGGKCTVDGGVVSFS